MQKREARFNTLFNHWVKNVFKKTAAFELKQAVNGRLPFSALKPHQAEALDSVRTGVLAYKIPDVGYQTPFDGFCMAGESSYVVINYSDFFCLIDIDVFMLESKINEEKSLTADRAKEIAFMSVDK
jgi:hypothetical protein